MSWERIRLPAIAEENDLLGRAPGTALWPERYGLDYLAEQKRGGEYGFASLYQQSPRPRGDQLFREPARFELKDWREHWKRTPMRLMQSCDPAATAKASADYSARFVVAVEGRGNAAKMWIVDGWRGQVEIPYLVRHQLIPGQAKWKNVPTGIEAVAGFKAVPQMMRDIDRRLRVLELHPQGDKFTRAQALAAAWNEGRVLVPLGEPWADALIAEAQEFTGLGDTYDDQVDALANAWNHLVGGLEQTAPTTTPSSNPFG